MTPAFTLAQAADLLHKSPRWLREWVRANPADKDGEPFYTPVGRDKLFHAADILRIERALREEVSCRSNSGRRAPVKRRILKSAERIEGQRDHSAWKQAAELTGDPTLLSSSGPSKNASTSMDDGQRRSPRLRLIQGNQPS